MLPNVDSPGHIISFPCHCVEKVHGKSIMPGGFVRNVQPSSHTAMFVITMWIWFRCELSQRSNLAVKAGRRPGTIYNNALYSTAAWKTKGAKLFSRGGALEVKSRLSIAPMLNTRRPLLDQPDLARKYCTVLASLRDRLKDRQGRFAAGLSVFVFHYETISFVTAVLLCCGAVTLAVTWLSGCSV